MKFITETFLFLVFVYCVTYLLFSFGNGSFDFTTWVKDSQENLAITCSVVTIFTFVVQIIRHIEL